MAQFVIGGRVGSRPKGRRAISCIYEEDEGTHSLDRFFKTGLESGIWSRPDPDPFLSLQLHSEYRSTYRWHEFTPNRSQDVVRNPPLSSNSKLHRFDNNKNGLLGGAVVLAVPLVGRMLPTLEV